MITMFLRINRSSRSRSSSTEKKKNVPNSHRINDQVFNPKIIERNLLRKEEYPPRDSIDYSEPPTHKRHSQSMKDMEIK
jgi:hypothetical protein